MSVGTFTCAGSEIGKLRPLLKVKVFALLVKIICDKNPPHSPFIKGEIL